MIKISQEVKDRLRLIEHSLLNGWTHTAREHIKELLKIIERREKQK